jgi:5-formyltetrahydrofolate cyclo-ligase
LDNESSRKLQREQLLAARRSPDGAAREKAVQQQVADVTRAGVRSLGFYFPIRGEPDLRDVVAAWLETDPRRVAALPVVVGDSLEFRVWTSDAPMQAGEFGIPVPAMAAFSGLPAGAGAVSTMRGTVHYGGGYYDRTLAARSGCWWSASPMNPRVATIGPQPHDAADPSSPTSHSTDLTQSAHRAALNLSAPSP